MENDKWKMTSPCTIVDCLATFTTAGGAGGLVVLAGFKPVAGRREAAWVGSIPTRLRQTIRDVSLRRTILNKSRWLPPIGVLVLACTVSAVAQERVSPPLGVCAKELAWQEFNS